MNRSEALAERILRSILDADLQYVGDQPRRSHDFDIVFRDGSTAPLEVTRSVDQNVVAGIAAVRKHGSTIPRERCDNGWWIVPSPEAEIKLVLEEADEYLAAIEPELEEDRFHFPMNAHECPSVLRIFQDLGIEYGSKIHSGADHILATPGSEGGWVNAQNVVDALELEANKLDNTGKLTGSPSGEAHLFVEMDFNNFLPWVSLIDEDPPNEPPRFPDVITDIWAAAIARDGVHYRVWHAKNGQIWSDKGFVRLT